MKALCWHGHGDVRIDNVPDPKIQHSQDIILKVTACAICGSDLHLLDGYMPTMESGDILGHEFMGVVEEVGKDVKNLKKGDRVVVPFNIACGTCFFCKKGLFSACDGSNPNKEPGEKLMGHAPSGLFGYSHMTGGYSGGQAEFVRVPFADVGPVKVSDALSDEQALFLSDIFPTGYMAAENAEIEPGDTVAIWGCGPVGQFAIKCAWMFNPKRVIAIDNVPERLEMAAREGKAEVINFEKEDVYERLQEITGGRGPDRCIDAVGAEASGHGGFDAAMDRVKAAVLLTTDRIHALRQAIYCCRKAGTVSIPGVYVGFPDKFPLGGLMNKGLTIKTGQTHTHRYMKKLMDMIEAGRIDPSFVITHKIGLDAVPEAYKTFKNKDDGCIKVFIRP